MEKIEVKVLECVPYQKCPVCDGEGVIKTPSRIEKLLISVTCNVCKGAKIIPMHIVNLPFIQREEDSKTQPKTELTVNAKHHKQ